MKKFVAWKFNTAMLVFIHFFEYRYAEYMEEKKKGGEVMQPIPIPYPDDIPDHPLRPRNPDDPDEEKYEVLYDFDL